MSHTINDANNNETSVKDQNASSPLSSCLYGTKTSHSQLTVTPKHVQRTVLSVDDTILSPNDESINTGGHNSTTLDCLLNMGT
jgi:hypothetical protein